MEFVQVTREGAVGAVRIDRPPVNAISEALAGELERAFDEMGDDDIRSVVITGQPHFAAGADIKGFQDTLERGERETMARGLKRAIKVLEELAKPTIAAVHGFALGGGLELALACDFRYLAEDAVVGQPEVLLGLIPGAGGTQRLPRVVGSQRAREMIYTGRQVDAGEALEIGLADRVAPTSDLLEIAMEDAREWATKATVAIAAAKRAISEGTRLPLDEGLGVEGEGFDRTFGSQDGAEGVLAFVEKRAPDFTGR